MIKLAPAPRTLLDLNVFNSFTDPQTVTVLSQSCSVICMDQTSLSVVFIMAKLGSWLVFDKDYDCASCSSTPF